MYRGFLTLRMVTYLNQHSESSGPDPQANKGSDCLAGSDIPRMFYSPIIIGKSLYRNTILPFRRFSNALSNFL